MPADPKPPTVVKDPDLLSALKAIWCSVGCACCRVKAPLDAEMGWSVQLHHLDKRGRPDDPLKILGLCGPFLSGCHDAAEAHQIKFNDGEPPTAWCDTRNGGGVWQPLHFPHDEVAHLGVGLTPPAPESHPLEHRLLPPAPTGGQEDAHAPLPAHVLTTAQQRLVATRELVIVAEQNRLLIALNLHAAWQGAEHEQLGMEWSQYLDAVGVSRSSATKMLTAVSIITPARLQEGVKQYDRELSLERVYQAARGARAGRFSVGDALEIAATRPVHDIVALLKGEPDDRQTCVCQTCGAVHTKRGGYE